MSKKKNPPQPDVSKPSETAWPARPIGYDELEVHANILQEAPPESAAADAVPLATVGACGACRHWQPVEGQVGVCRRSPPVSCPSGGPVLGGTSRYWGQWPVTQRTDYCGEFIAR